jgi:hypothetical protein
MGRCIRLSRAGGQWLPFITVFPACSARTGWGGTGRTSCECSVINTAARAKAARPPGSPANWRCIVLEELSGVALPQEPWRTAPNHSRPASCIVDADIDADDHPPRDPQQGQ